MAGKSSKAATGRPGDEAKKIPTSKVGITLSDETLYRFRLFCAAHRSTPSKMLQSIVQEKIRGFSLPAGFAYIPVSRPVAAETPCLSGEDSEASQEIPASGPEDESVAKTLSAPSPAGRRGRGAA